MKSNFNKLQEAEQKALRLFDWIEGADLIKAGRSEQEISAVIFQYAEDLFGIKKFWHKRIVRAGLNTLCPYDDSPPNRIIEQDDIVFIDLGPVFDEWESDIGRTFVIGNDPEKIRLAKDAEDCWFLLQERMQQNTKMTANELYRFAELLAKERGWLFGGNIAGHLIGKFPHDNIATEKIMNYIHPLNFDVIDRTKHWILEIHLIHPERSYGAFFEQLAI
jgi:Xaa-Pro dipeptidase